MALRKLLAKKRLDEKRKAFDVIDQELLAIEERKSALNKRSEEAAAAIEETNEESTEEEKKTVEEEVEAIEAEDKAIQEELEAKQKEKTDLEAEIKALEEELEKDEAPESEERKVVKNETVRGESKMNNLKIRQGFFKGWEMRTAQELVERKDVKEYLDQVRTMAKEKRAITGAEVFIPETVIALLRDSIHKYSKLLKYVWLRPLKGNARVNVTGQIPEAVWTEACAILNELDLNFHQYEMDGYKVGGFVAVCNALLEDSDLNLANEILNNIGQAIGYAVDKAILYGTGKKMPTGIVTRLAQTAQPETWGTKAPAWVDLSATHIAQVTGATAEELFSDLLLKAGNASNTYGDGGLFWAMNRKTYLTLMSKLVTFNANGALVASVNSSMPIVGGTIEEIPFMADGDIVGGFGGQYLMVERSGMKFASSEHAQFIEDNTVFKGTARYDGAPLQGEGFVALNITGASPTTEVAFAPDTANEVVEEPVPGV